VSYGKPQNSIGRISPDVLKSVVLIENKLGQNIGTGFIVSKTNYLGQLKYYLITNKHVIGTWIPGKSFVPDSVIYVMLYSKDHPDPTISATIKISKNGVLDSIVALDEDLKVDVVAINLKVMESFSKQDICDTKSFPFECLVPMRQIETKVNCSIGSELFALGYPAGKMSLPEGTPLAKKIGIACHLDPTSYFMWNHPLTDSTKLIFPSADSIFLVEGQLYHGNSGGPVIVPLDDKTANNQNYVLGIVSSGNTKEGLAFVFSSDYVIKLITRLENK
jgi:hypothetical protein